ncbi:MAG TPA: HXXEE domain-containing protein, partial [Puia sp.]|nr:HXXEE domain-containing protein [Puia sp.]
WAFFASYIVHILDETILAGGFVEFVTKNFWPSYRMRMFFWFNAAFIAAIAVGNLVFDAFGGHWVIVPVFFVAGFVTHVVTFHLFWTIRLNTYSPGLVSSLLYVVIFYLLIRYGLRGNLVSRKDFTIGTVAGVATLGLFLTVGPTVLFPRLMRDRRWK